MPGGPGRRQGSKSEEEQSSGGGGRKGLPEGAGVAGNGERTPFAGTSLGQLGDVEFGQIDPRTDFMRMLELASGPLLLQTLLNPGGAAGLLGGTPLGQGGSGPGSGLLASLLGPGAMGGASSGGPVPGSGLIGGGQDPLTALLMGAFGGQAGVPQEVPGGGMFSELFKNLGVNFLQTGGQLRDDALNIVGEAGPEAVIGNQVVPLQTLDQISQQASGLQQEQGRLRTQLQQASGGPAEILEPLQQQLAQVMQQQEQLQNVPIGGAASLNMDAVNAITGVRPSQSQATGGDIRTGFQVAPSLGGGQASTGGNQAGQAPVGGQQTQFTSGNQATGGGGTIQRLLEQNPEQQAFGVAQQFLTGADGSGGLLGQAPGAGVIEALQPVFERNLQRGLTDLTDRVPSVFNSAAGVAGTDLTRQALQDFNLTAAQAAQQGIGQQLQGLGTLGQMAVPAGQNPFQRALGAGQFGLAAQNQAFQQQTGPAMQLLAMALGAASPTGMQTVGGPFTGEGGTF